MSASPREAGARRIYRRLLLSLFPREERERYGTEMEDAFASLYRHADAAGVVSRVLCWMGAVWDALLRGSSARLARRSGDSSTGGREMLATFWSDVRYSVRALARRPLFAVTATLTIALGIGATASVFTVVDGFLFTPLPYEEPEELVTLWSANPSLGWDRTDVNPADIWDLRTRSTSLEDLAVFYEDALNLTGDGPPELVNAIRMSPNTLALLGRAPVEGRDFFPSEMGPGKDGVAILQEGFWERRFARDPSVLGSTLMMDGRAFTVVGIMPADFRFLSELPDVFLPLDLDSATFQRGPHFAEAVGRLAEGSNLERAQREMVELAQQLERDHPEANQGWTYHVFSTHRELVGEIARRASMILMAAVGFVLLMACVNVANLLLARGGPRAGELAVRAALGAGRSRIFRQLLTESLVLAGVGGALGVAIGQWGYRSIVAALPSTLPPVFRFEMDGSVLVFVVAVTLLSGVLFGVIPALRSTRHEMTSLREVGRAGRAKGATRLDTTLVVLQTAMAVVLSVGGALLMKSVAGMRSQELGFDPDHVLTVRLAPPSTEYPGESELRAFWSALEDRVRALPGVVAAGTTQSHPLMGSNWGGVVRVVGQEHRELRVRLTHASPGLFDALSIRLLRGRGVTAADDERAPRVAVVNESFVRNYLGEGVDPLTAKLAGPPGEDPVSIVGVVEDVIERSIDRPAEPTLYVPTSHAVSRTRSIVVRTASEPEQIVESLQRAVWSVDPKIPVYSVETMDALVDRRVGSFSVIAELMGAFALMSLVLGAVGIYGVTAHAVGQRTSEIGVRIALGAERRALTGMLLRQGGLRTALGLLLGLGAALGLSSAMGNVLIGVSPRDPVTFVSVGAALAAVSLLALYLPIRRAARVDPIRALAAE